MQTSTEGKLAVMIRNKPPQPSRRSKTRAIPEPDYPEFQARIQQLVDRFGSQVALARKAGLEESLISGYLKKRNEPRRPVLIRLARAAGVSVGWLAAGERTQESEYVYVPRRAVRASAGAGNEVESEQIVDYLAFKKDWISRNFGSPAGLVVIEADGESMAPLINDRDLVLVDTASRRIVDGGIYVLLHELGLRIKRLHQSAAGVEITSDNPDPRYPRETTPSERIAEQVIGRVVWTGGRPR